jgi:hypothetical protein
MKPKADDSQYPEKEKIENCANTFICNRYKRPIEKKHASEKHHYRNGPAVQNCLHLPLNKKYRENALTGLSNFILGQADTYGVTVNLLGKTHHLCLRVVRICRTIMIGHPYFSLKQSYKAHYSLSNHPNDLFYEDKISAIHCQTLLTY